MCLKSSAEGNWTHDFGLLKLHMTLAMWPSPSTVGSPISALPDVMVTSELTMTNVSTTDLWQPYLMLGYDQSFTPGILPHLLKTWHRNTHFPVQVAFLQRDKFYRIFICTLVLTTLLLVPTSTKETPTSEIVFSSSDLPLLCPCLSRCLISFSRCPKSLSLSIFLTFLEGHSQWCSGAHGWRSLYKGL